MKKKQYTIPLFFSSFLLVVSMFVCSAQGASASSYLSINSGSPRTVGRAVSLSITPPARATEMKISNSASFRGAQWEKVKTQKDWVLSYGRGVKRVYVKFKYENNTLSPIYSDLVQLAIPRSMSVSFTINGTATTTVQREVTLDISHSTGVEEMSITNEPPPKTGIDFVPVQQEVTWFVSPGRGDKTVYITFKDANNSTRMVEKDIFYDKALHAVEEGSVIKGSGSRVYYVGYSGKIHPFLDPTTFHSYFSFSEVQYVSDVVLDGYHVGKPMCVRPGTWLIKFRGSSAVYAVEDGCYIRKIRSEAEAYVLYGRQWPKRVMTISSRNKSLYKERIYPLLPKAIDWDRDGIDKETERRYGSSDFRSDSDNDRLSDYEEIRYWFTDPVEKDTDGDGIYDGNEIILGRLPNGSGSITQIPQHTYYYPRGVVMYRWWDDKYIYQKGNDRYYYRVARSSRDKRFSAIDLDKKFLIRPPFEMPFVPQKKKYIQERTDGLGLPLVKRNNRFELL